MKKRNVLSGILLVLVVLLTQGVNAQNIQVQNGATVHYSVTAVTGSTVSSCVWSLTGGASGFVSSGTLNQTVTWNTISTGNILSVYPVSDKGCNGASRSDTFDVVATLAVTIAWGAASPVCPQTVNQPGGGNVATSVTLTGGVPAGAWSFNYTLDGGAVATESGLNGVNPSINLNLALTNPSNTAPAAHSLVITSYTVNGTTYVPAVAPTLTVTVYPTPAINPIAF